MYNRREKAGALYPHQPSPTSGVSCVVFFRPSTQAEAVHLHPAFTAFVRPCTARFAQAKFSPQGRERDLARTPAGTMARIVPDNPLHSLHPWRSDVPSEHLLRQAPKRGNRRSRRRVLGQNGFGDFCRNKSHPRTGRVMCRMHKCRGRMDALERPPR